MTFILGLKLQKSEEFWVIVIALLVAWLLAAHQSEQYTVFGVIGTYLYWTCRILIEAAFFVAAVLAADKYLKKLIPEWVGYGLAVLVSLVPFTLAVTTLDLIVGLPELGFNGDPVVPGSRVQAILLELCYLLDNHIFLSMLLLMPRLLLGQNQAALGVMGEELRAPDVTVPDNQVVDTTQTFFELLEPPLEGHICAMEAQEHYIQITTTTESRMILHRFSDAVRQTPASLGMRVHRSHWVAHSAVQELLVEGQSMKLKLYGDKIVPVSRTFRAVVEERYVVTS